jgi:2-isopropylmalate synthase/UPF0716 protein FxsA
MVTTNIASKIGGFATFIEIVLSAVAGLFLLSNLRYTAAGSLGMVMSGQMSLEEFQRLSLFSIIGAFLLIIPGFFSDIIGLLMQFSAVGTFIAKRIFGLKNKNSFKKERDEEIIDVEIIDSDGSIK